jgi:dTMP kinase
MSGLFITFEGGEGSGKTTQIKLLYDTFARAGKKCLLTREPGGSPCAEAIRNLLLTGAGDKWHPVSETLMFQAARVEHVERLLKPALARGETVLCDRFLDSTLVYQGLAKGLGLEYISRLHHFTLGNFGPHLTLILDIAPAVGLKRAKQRAGDETRFEGMDIAFHQKVREGFLAIAKLEPARCMVIDASGSAEDVHKAIVKALADRLP